MKKLFISQPMNGKTNEEILAVRTKAIESAERELGEKVEVIDSFFKDAPADASPMWYLGESIKLLATADVAYFAEGWEKARGCVIENQCAIQYGISLVIEAPSETAQFTFKRAYEALKRGADIKRRHWKGFWRKENGTIVMHCKDGRNVPIQETEDIFFTLDNLFAEDWEVTNGEQIEGLDISTFTFGEAIRRLKNGQKVARKGWNGRGMFVVYQKGYPNGIPCNKQTAEAWDMKEGDLFVCNPYLQIKNVNGSHSMWVPSIGDVLAEDWYTVE